MTWSITAKMRALGRATEKGVQLTQGVGHGVIDAVACVFRGPLSRLERNDIYLHRILGTDYGQNELLQHQAERRFSLREFATYIVLLLVYPALYISQRTNIHDSYELNSALRKAFVDAPFITVPWNNITDLGTLKIFIVDALPHILLPTLQHVNFPKSKIRFIMRRIETQHNTDTRFAPYAPTVWKTVAGIPSAYVAADHRGDALPYFGARRVSDVLKDAGGAYVREIAFQNRMDKRCAPDSTVNGQLTNADLKQNSATQGVDLSALATVEQCKDWCEELKNENSVCRCFTVRNCSGDMCSCTFWRVDVADLVLDTTTNEYAPPLRPEVGATAYWPKMMPFGRSSDVDGYVMKVGGPYLSDKCNPDVLADQFGEIISGGYLDRFTGSLTVDFVATNPNFEMHSGVLMEFQFHPTGGLDRTLYVESLQLGDMADIFDGYDLEDALSFKCQWMDVVYAGILLYYLLWEFVWLHRYGSFHYFSTLSRLVTVAALVLNGVTITLCLIYINTDVDDTESSESEMDFTFQFLDKKVVRYRHFCRAAGATIFIAWLRMLQYLQDIVPRVAVLMDTIHRAVTPIFFFLVVVGMMFLGIVYWANIGFGPRHLDFTSIGQSVLTLSSMIFGDVSSFEKLQMEYPMLGSIYFIVFMLFFFFIILNVNLAILNQAYQESLRYHSEKSFTHIEAQKNRPMWKRIVPKKCRKRFKRKQNDDIEDDVDEEVTPKAAPRRTSVSEVSSPYSRSCDDRDEGVHDVYPDDPAPSRVSRNTVLVHSISMVFPRLTSFFNDQSAVSEGSLHLARDKGEEGEGKGYSLKSLVVLYAIFSIAYILGLILLLRVHARYKVREMFEEALLEPTFTTADGVPGATFWDVKSYADVQSFMTTVLPQVLYDTSDTMLFDGSSFTLNPLADYPPAPADSCTYQGVAVDCEQVVVRNWNIIIGQSPVRISTRLFEVKPMENISGTALPFLRKDRMLSVKPFAGETFAEVTKLDQDFYNAAQKTMIETYFSPYSRGIAAERNGASNAWVSMLPANRSRALALLNDFDVLMTYQTAFVSVDFVLYNANEKMFSYVALWFMALPSGEVVPDFKVASAPLEIYDGGANVFGAILQLFYVLMVIFYIIEEIYDIVTEARRKSGRGAKMKVIITHFTSDIYNVLDLVSYVISIFTISSFFALAFGTFRTGFFFQEIPRWNNCKSLPGDWCSDSDVINEFAHYMEQWQTLSRYASVNVIIIFFRALKFFRKNTTMNVIFETLTRGIGDIGWFSVMMVIILLSFAHFGHLIFGGVLEDFHSIGRSIQICFEMVCGSFSYDYLAQGDNVMAVWFYFPFMFAFYFLLMNIFFAIINYNFQSLTQTTEDSEERRSQDKITRDCQLKGRKNLELSEDELDCGEQWMQLPPHMRTWAVAETKELLNYFAPALSRKLAAPMFKREKVVLKESRKLKDLLADARRELQTVYSKAFQGDITDLKQAIADQETLAQYILHMEAEYEKKERLRNELKATYEELRSGARTLSIDDADQEKEN
eukprot:GEMP01001913.1.p1 GENE.GEMP01001913.1~~GEMP01001913.1.p1  ORF type:complete len:1514 (+),score=342.92 GEMP01001913.1:238-4779(+)